MPAHGSGPPQARPLHGGPGDAVAREPPWQGYAVAVERDGCSLPENARCSHSTIGDAM